MRRSRAARARFTSAPAPWYKHSMARRSKSGPPATHGILRALLRHDGAMVAAVVAIPGGRARLFVVGRGEPQEAFVGRVSRWVKDQGAAGLTMQSPDTLPQGTDAGEVLLRLKAALGAERAGPGATEFEIEHPEGMILPRDEG